MRVVAIEASERHFSFTLGTLPQHPLVRVGAPAMRVVQTQFAGDSVRSLQRFLAQAL